VHSQTYFSAAKVYLLVKSEEVGGVSTTFVKIPLNALASNFQNIGLSQRTYTANPGGPI
jgi:hypothetical protein